jgi:hypothetical protein
MNSSLKKTFNQNKILNTNYFFILNKTKFYEINKNKILFKKSKIQEIYFCF